MVYLTIETLKNARGFVNPCKKRELDLRDLSLDTIENLGLTLDQYDVIDVSGNYLKRLENFPTLQRLECITAHNNSIATIDSDTGVTIPSDAGIIMIRRCSKIWVMTKPGFLESNADSALKFLCLIKS